MSQRRLNVGSIVKIKRIAATARNGNVTFRVEQLLTLEGGVVLYKVKSDREPFDRVVGEQEVVPQATGL